MNVLQAILLGAVQGVTEFLPVSSSAHLALAHTLIGSESDLFFDVLLHGATLVVVLFYFKDALKALTVQTLITLGVASIPAAFIGLLFKDAIEQLFSSPGLLILPLLVTASLNFYLSHMLSNQKNLNHSVSLTQGVLIGLAQACAVFPGITRLGSTTVAGVVQGIEVKKAIEFSFLLMIPVTLGALALSAKDFLSGDGVATSNLFSYAIGSLVAMGVGFQAIKLLMYIVEKNKFAWLGVYCLGFAVISLLL